MQRTGLLHHYCGKRELHEMANLLSGRGKHEMKLGHRYVRSHLRIQTNYRQYTKAHFERALTRNSVQAAMMEHGTDWMRMRNDLSRQKTVLLNDSMVNLAFTFYLLPFTFYLLPFTLN